MGYSFTIHLHNLNAQITIYTTFYAMYLAEFVHSCLMRMTNKATELKKTTRIWSKLVYIVPLYLLLTWKIKRQKSYNTCILHAYHNTCQLPEKWNTKWPNNDFFHPVIKEKDGNSSNILGIIWWLVNIQYTYLTN